MGIPKISSIMLHIINAIFLVAAIAVVIIMLVNMVNYKHYLDLLGDNTSWAIAVLIVGIAVLLVIIAAIGIWGTLTQNTALLKIYIAIIAVFMTLLIIAGAVSFAKREETFKTIEENMIEKLKLYSGSDSVEYESIVLDDIQQWYNCCGVVNHKDWTKHHPTYNQSKLAEKPDSCFPNGDSAQPIHGDGCLELLDHSILEKHWTIGGAIAGISAYLLLAIGMACMVIKNNKVKTIME